MTMSHERSRCQHCKLPLVIHESLEDLSIAQSNLITLARSNIPNDLAGDFPIGDEPIIPSDRLSLLQTINSNKPLINMDATDSYEILPSQSKLNETTPRLTTISDNVNTLDKINDVLNSGSEIDYPVCTFCADLIISQMKSKLDASMKEKQTYLQFLKKLGDQQAPNPAKSEEHVSEIDELRRHESELIAEYSKLKEEAIDLTKQLESLEIESENLAREEQKTWAIKNQYALDLAELASEKDAVKAQHDFNLSQLEKLRKANVYNDVFKISHDGRFGTICGLRLGSLDSCKISWHEINAALGQLILLLSTLVSRLNITITNYSLKPLASFSKIEKTVKDPNGVAKTIVLECYSSGDSSLQRLVNHYKFDAAMSAILEILKQMESHLKKVDDSIDLPYKMNDDKVGDLSIKLQSRVTSDEWTTACKYLLINTKWLLAYSTVHKT